MPIDQHRFLIAVVAYATQNSRRQWEILSVHRMSSEIDQLGVNPELPELCIKPVRHRDHVLAMASIARDSKDQTISQTLSN